MAVRVYSLLIFCLCLPVFLTSSIGAQTGQEKTGSPGETDGGQSEKRPDNPNSKSTATRQQFDQLTREFRRSVGEAQLKFFEYWNATSVDDSFPSADDFEAITKQGNAILEQLIPVGEKLFDEQITDSGKADDALAYFITKVLVKRFDEGQFEQSFLLAQKLVQNNPDNTIAEIYLVRSALLTNRFGPEIAKLIQKHAEHFQEEDSVFETERTLMLSLFDLAPKFERELTIRRAEQQADDLPRVLFETSKGEFVIELFENEAPLAVANFISLVENHHYDGLIFQTVIDRTVAETGVLTEDLTVRDIGYTIQDEFDGPNARMVFAGSVVMYSETPNAGGARFFIALAALPNFNGRQTVFGRVISGMETVYRLNHTFKIEEQQQIEIEDVTPDRVISAKVIRKRDHEYKPTKVKSINGKE